LITLVTLGFIVSGLIEVLLPVVFGYYLIKRLNTSNKIWMIGALMFIVSLIRIPLNTYLSAIVTSGTITSFSFTLIYLIPCLTAGVFEESARFIGLKYLIKEESYRTGLTYGAGHGGIESILLVGVNVLITGILIVVNPESIPQAQLNAILSMPWYMPFIGAYERVMTMIIHLSLSIMVLETIRTKKIMYLILAVIAHTAVNYLAIVAVGYSVLYSELVVTGFALGLGEWAYSKIKDEIMV
jgi:uncharacterized membrane protein YhfC